MIGSSIPSSAALPVATADDELREAADIAAARRGCDDAFRRLVERHQHRIHRLCYHYLGNDADALEACQDTFVRAHRALPRFKPRARLSTWLHRIALNLCRDRLRRLRKTVPLEGLELPCTHAAPDESAIRDADLAKLDLALAALPPRLREPIILTCLDGLSHADCAAILKCSERAVEGRLYRARQRLTAWWKKSGG